MKRFLMCVFIGATAASLHGAGEQSQQTKAIIIHAPRPEMPSSARVGHHTGSGAYRLFFTAEGIVTRVAIERSSGWADLDQAAINTFRQWRARPSYARSIVVPAYFGVGHQ